MLVNKHGVLLYNDMPYLLQRVGYSWDKYKLDFYTNTNHWQLSTFSDSSRSYVIKVQSIG